MTASHAQPSEDAPTLGPDALSRLYAGDGLALLLAGTTLLLQVAHPVVGAGVGDHSVFKTDPWGRLKRTTEFSLRLLYKSPEEALLAGRELRERHRDIKGADGQGRRYFALDPEAYAWVHMSTFYIMLKSQECFGTPISPADQKQLYEEWLVQGRVLGIRDQDMPADIPAFNRYFDRMVLDRLEDNPVVRDILEETTRRVVKPDFLGWLPTPLWDAVYRPAGNWVRIVTLCTTPPALLSKLGVFPTAREQRLFRRLQRGIRLASRVLPDRLRYLPAALPSVRHLKELRRHP